MNLEQSRVLRKQIEADHPTAQIIGAYVREHYHDRTALVQRLIQFTLKKTPRDNESLEKLQDIIKKIEGKLRHTDDVVDFMIMIAEGEGLCDEFDRLIALAYLHDVERATQALFGSFSDIKTEFSHADMGADMYMSFPLVFPSETVDDMLKERHFIQGIRDHSKKHPESAHMYSLLTRDADKLALFHAAEFMWAMDRYPSDTPDAGIISDEIYLEFMNKEPVTSGKVNNKVGAILLRLAWFFDLNTHTARLISVQEGFVERILDKLREVISPTQIDRLRVIEKMMEEWEQDTLTAKLT